MSDGRGKTPHRLYRYKVSTITGYLESGMTDKQIAARLHMTLLQWDRYKATHDEIRELYNELNTSLKTNKKALMLHDVQFVYDNIVNYLQYRDKKKLPYTIPSFCAYLKISKDTFYKYLHENDNKQLIETENGKKAYISIAELFNEMYGLIEANLVDFSILRNSIGAIFTLKNHYGYADRQTINVENERSINVSWNTCSTLPAANKEHIIPEHTIESEQVSGEQVIHSDNLKLSEPKTDSESTGK